MKVTRTQNNFEFVSTMSTPPPLRFVVFSSDGILIGGGPCGLKLLIDVCLFVVMFLVFSSFVKCLHKIEVEELSS